MTTTKLIIETAARLHKEGKLEREELIRIIARCIDAVAIENGYAEKYGLPSRQGRSAR